MRWYHMIGGLALVLLLTMIGLPGSPVKVAKILIYKHM